MSYVLCRTSALTINDVLNMWLGGHCGDVYSGNWLYPFPRANKLTSRRDRCQLEWENCYQTWIHPRTIEYKVRLLHVFCQRSRNTTYALVRAGVQVRCHSLNYPWSNLRQSLQCSLLKSQWRRLWWAIKFITHVERIHSKAAVRRDIMPVDFLIGIDKLGHLWYCKGIRGIRKAQTFAIL